MKKLEKNSKPQFYGIAEYKKEADGCLLGLFTNILAGGRIMPECARKKENDKERAKLEGYYHVSWIEHEEGVIPGILEVSVISKENFIYKFKWTDEDQKEIWFEGIGKKIGENHYAVAYINVE
ncbi:MAG TPA: hypothetical protein DEH02_15030 [Bacteroidales bacterium]|nr:hypothetical protein [Bacteroidales bacterium]